MSKLLKPLFALVIVFSLFSCSDDLGPCANVGIPCDCGQFLMLDRWGEPMIGENKTYHPDSIKILNDPEKWNLRVEDSLVFFNYGSLNSNEEYYIYLSSSVQDTIILNFTFTPGKCFTVKNIYDFNYNGGKTTIENNRVLIIKI